MKLRWLLALPLLLVACSPKKSAMPENIPTKTVPETLFFCVAQQGSQAEIGALAQKSIGPLYETLGSLGRQPAGALEIICPHWGGPEAQNKIVFAIPVESEFAVEAPYYLWKAPPLKCAWVVHAGPMSTIRATWMKLGDDVNEAGLRRINAWREIYTHWVSPESPENRTELQMGIE